MYRHYVLCVCVLCTAGPKGLVLTFIHCLKEESVSVLTQLIEIGGVKSPSLKKVRTINAYITLNGYVCLAC